jgi:hypothetical protein
MAEQKIVEDSIRKNVVTAKTIAVCDFVSDQDGRSRPLTIVPVPKNAFNNKGAWLPSGGVTTGFHKCVNCGFYFSSGVSNVVNFTGIWFPFIRVKEKPAKYSQDMARGWIHKSYNLSTAKDFLTLLSRQFGIEITEFLKVFLEKFSHWWQVQISAGLPSAPYSLWNTHVELIKLRSVALQYDYFAFPDRGQKPFMANPKIVKEWIVPELPRNAKFTTPEEVNGWLQRNGALCEESD